MDEFTASQYKAYANNIVGIWFNEVPDEVLVFSFLFDYTQQSDLLILNKGSRVSASYSIHNMQDGDWFLVIWNEEENKTMFYHLELLSPDIMIITCNSKMELKVYERKIDHAFVHKVLEEIQAPIS
jgi:hypothetical protein